VFNKNGSSALGCTSPYNQTSYRLVIGVDGSMSAAGGITDAQVPPTSGFAMSSVQLPHILNGSLIQTYEPTSGLLTVLLSHVDSSPRSIYDSDVTCFWVKQPTPDRLQIWQLSSARSVDSCESTSAPAAGSDVSCVPAAGMASDERAVGVAGAASWSVFADLTRGDDSGGGSGSSSSAPVPGTLTTGDGSATRVSADSPATAGATPAPIDNTIAIIVGSAVGGLALVCIVLGIIGFCICRRAKRDYGQPDTNPLYTPSFRSTRNTDETGPRSTAASIHMTPTSTHELRRSSPGRAPVTPQGSSVSLTGVSRGRGKTAADFMCVRAHVRVVSRAALIRNIIIAEEDVERGRRIGEGAFGVVYQGRWKNLPVAIKELIGGCAVTCACICVTCRHRLSA
jgi:hypothetical protein